MASNSENQDPKIELSFQLDEDHTKRIQECIAKGTLKIQVLEVEDKDTGRSACAYLYD